jgi:hypothetical protein
MSRDRIIEPRAAPVGGTPSSGCRRLVQCRTMPHWLSVNETNTPMMYSWINRVVLASKAQISRPASTARITMPLLNTSRSPRRCSCRGR